MDEFDFTLDGKPRQISRDLVIRSMRNQVPGRIQTYAVDIEGKQFPVKQVLASSLQVPVTSFVSTRAQAILEKLGFPVINVELEPNGGNRPAVGSSTQARKRALAFAIRLHAGRSDLQTADVLKTADAFQAWLLG